MFGAAAAAAQDEGQVVASGRKEVDCPRNIVANGRNGAMRHPAEGSRGSVPPAAIVAGRQVTDEPTGGRTADIAHLADLFR